jgi:UDP-glucose 4-epimerase
MVAVLVTGGSGYIGSALIAYLLRFKRITQVVNYDIKKPSWWYRRDIPEKYVLSQNSILDYQMLVSILEMYKIDIVVHLAACSSVTACNEDAYFADLTNKVGTETVIAAMKKVGCRNLVYASTSSVYGDDSDPPYTEDMEPAPVSTYGKSKLSGEEIILAEHPGNYFILRLFNVVGTSGYKRVDEGLTDMGFDRIFSALMSGKMTVYGNDYSTEDGTCMRDYVALMDVYRAFGLAIWRLVDSSNSELPTCRHIINIGSGVPTSVLGMINTWNEVSSCIQEERAGNKNCRRLKSVSYTYGPRREGDPDRVYADNSKANTILGWQPQKKIEDIIYDLAIDTNIADHGTQDDTSVVD